MSLIVVGYSHHGIVVTSDKRITTTVKTSKEGEPEKYEVFPLTDTEKKTFIFPHGVSISYCGQSDINGSPISFVIETFIRNCQLKDPHEIANAFLGHLHKLNPAANTRFFVSGYSGSRRVVIEGYTNTNKLKNHIDSDTHAGFSWMGMTDTATSLIKNNDIAFSSLSLQDFIDLSIFLVQATAKMMRFSRTAKTVSENYDSLIITPDGYKWLTSNEYHA